MQPAILGKKIGMTQVYDAAGVLHPVTVVQAGPCSVLQVKSSETDGYAAVQIGFGDVKTHRAAKPQIGHAAKVSAGPKQFVREVRLTDAAEAVEAGASLTVETFEGVAFVDVIGTTKGFGYQGGMKRHGFKGVSSSHGSHRNHRKPGSIGASSTPSRVFKGMRMAGRMGGDRVTVLNLTVHSVDLEKGILLVKGAVPGARGRIVFVRNAVKGA